MGGSVGALFSLENPSLPSVALPLWTRSRRELSLLGALTTPLDQDKKGEYKTGPCNQANQRYVIHSGLLLLGLNALKCSLQWERPAEEVPRVPTLYCHQS